LTDVFDETNLTNCFSLHQINFFFISSRKTSTSIMFN